MATIKTRERSASRRQQSEADAIKPTEAGESEPTEAVEAAAEEQPQPKPALPLAVGDLGAGKIAYHRPSLTMPDGTEVTCPHATWGHEKASAAARCLRKLAADNGVRVEVPES